MLLNIKSKSAITKINIQNAFDNAKHVGETQMEQIGLLKEYLPPRLEILVKDTEVLIKNSRDIVLASIFLK
jgi:hypothetical protein